MNNELDLGRLLKAFCDKNGVPLEKSFDLLKKLADVSAIAADLYEKNSKVNSSIKAITGEDSMMVCPNCGSHVLVEYKECIACGEELYEGASAQVKTSSKKAPAKVEEKAELIDYPSQAKIKKMKITELKTWVDLLEVDTDLEGKLSDIRKDIIEHIKELKTIDEKPANKNSKKKASEEIVEENTELLEDLEGEDQEDEDEEFEEFEDVDDEESEEEEFEEEELDDDDEESEDDDEELDEEEIEEEDEEELDEDDEFEDEEDEEELEDEEDEEDEELEDEELEDEEEEEIEEDDDDLDEIEEIEIEEPKKKKGSKKTKKKAGKKDSKLSDKKAEREAKRESLKKKIPSLAKKPSKLEDLAHAERVSLLAILGDSVGHKKTLAELKGKENVLKHLKKQLALWTKKNSKKK